MGTIPTMQKRRWVGDAKCITFSSARNMTLKRMTAGKIVYEFFMTAYFQMLGNFGLDVLEGEGKEVFKIFFIQ